METDEAQDMSQVSGEIIKEYEYGDDEDDPTWNPFGFLPEQCCYYCQDNCFGSFALPEWKSGYN